MIIADDEFVKISGILLPGTFRSIEIAGSALIEEIEIEGKGKKPKQATGYEDAKITIEITLLDDMEQDGIEAKTKFDKLEIIQDIFRKKDQSKPEIHTIINEHVTKRNINKVILKELSSRETNKKSELIVSLSFWEYEDIKIGTAKKSTTTSASSSKNINSNVGKEYQNYLNNDKGNAPKIKDKTSSTPAQDI